MTNTSSTILTKATRPSTPKNGISSNTVSGACEDHAGGNIRVVVHEKQPLILEEQVIALGAQHLVPESKGVHSASISRPTL